jgi:hypothetical protein
MLFFGAAEIGAGVGEDLFLVGTGLRLKAGVVRVKDCVANAFCVCGKIPFAPGLYVIGVISPVPSNHPAISSQLFRPEYSQYYWEISVNLLVATVDD